VKDAAQEAARFTLGFRKNLKSASIREQKFLLRQFVNNIVVDRGNNRVVCSLSRLPRINNPILSSILNNGLVYL
jgi:hypothetical protein